MRKYDVKEMRRTRIALVWLLFTATNVNVTLGNIYVGFTLASLSLLIIGITIFDKKLHITFQKKPGGTLQAIGWGFAGWIILLVTSVVVMRFVDPLKANIGSIILLLGATTPALATSKIANWLNFGVAIAFIETQLWARLVEFFADVFHINVDKPSVKKILGPLMILIIIFALVFMFFHLTSKGITAFSSLAVVFVMMMISLIMVAWFGETRQAVFMHIFANAVASYLMLFG